MKIPENYQTVMPYLILADAAGFIDFTVQVFQAALTHKHMRDEKNIQHGEVMIGGSTIMFADSTDQYPPRTSGFFVYVSDADAVFNRALSFGATPVSAMADQSYGRSGGFLDPFGNTWWITTPV